MNEISILRHVNYNGCIKLHEIHETANSVYFILEEIKGGIFLSLENKQKKILTKSEIKYVLESLLNTLKYLHKNNIIHRDIKPDNILMLHENTLNKGNLGRLDFSNVLKRVRSKNTMLALW